MYCFVSLLGTPYPYLDDEPFVKILGVVSIKLVQGDSLLVLVEGMGGAGIGFKGILVIKSILTTFAHFYHVWEVYQISDSLEDKKRGRSELNIKRICMFSSTLSSNLTSELCSNFLWLQGRKYIGLM